MVSQIGREGKDVLLDVRRRLRESQIGKVSKQNKKGNRMRR